MNFKTFLKKLSCACLIVGVIVFFIWIFFLFAQAKQIDIITAIVYLILIIIIIYNLTYAVLKTMKFLKETQRLIKILYEDIDVERYLRETKDAISKTKIKGYKLCFSIGLALGYSAKGEYRRAIDYMINLNIEDARTRYKALYYNNLAYSYCEVGNVEEAIKTYSQGEKFINKILKNPRYCASLLHTKGVIEYLKGNLSESEELLEKSKIQLIANNNLLASANLYIAKIYLQTERMQKSKLLLEYNMSQKLLPNIITETQKVIEEIESISSGK